MKIIVSSVLLCMSAASYAQSSITLYGVIDDGFTYTNNQNGHASYQMISGILQGSRWGLLGTEDMGNGTKAIFRLENGFDVNSGRLLQGSREFGRAAYVGLSNTTYGTLTAGRQLDSVVDFLGPLTGAGPWGILMPHPGDLDNTGIDFRLNNALKYTTPEYRGFKASGVYSFGGQAGDFSRDSAFSAGMSYHSGPLLLSAAYLSIDRPAEATPEGVWTSTNVIDGNYGIAAHRYQVAGGGAAYDFGKLKVNLTYTNTKFLGLNPALGAQIGGHASFDIIDINTSYAFTPSVLLGAAYNFTSGYVSSTQAKPKYHVASILLDYLLSKRFDVYGQVTYMRAAGDAAVADLAPVLAASTTRSQLAMRAAMRFKF